ncbi:hypothetical protein D3C84_1135300 [compost metagenome]
MRVASLFSWAAANLQFWGSFGSVIIYDSIRCPIAQGVTFLLRPIWALRRLGLIKVSDYALEPEARLQVRVEYLDIILVLRRQGW